MKTHPLLQYGHIDVVQLKAKSVGLSEVKDGTYLLRKTGAKNKSKLGYLDSFDVIIGEVFLVGNEDEVWVMFGDGNGWYKTSPVVSCTLTDMGFKFETWNSFYEALEVTK